MNQDNLILSSSDDYTIKLWSTEPTVLQSIKTFTEHTDGVTSVCFAPSIDDSIFNYMKRSFPDE